MTPNVKLASDNNAIEQVAFVLKFEAPFTHEEINSFIGKLPKLLETELPISNTSNTISFNVGIEAVPQPSSALSGIILQDNEHHWMLRADTNQIAVHCKEYTRWEQVKPHALKIIETACNLIKANDNDNRVIQIYFQCVDKFFEEELEEYKISNVFNPSSKFLPLNVSDNHTYWHANQGWFQDGNNVSPERRLHVLNISSASNNQTNVGQISTIDHLIRQDLDSLPLGRLFEDSNSCSIDKLLTEMHNNNKDVLKSLLSAYALQLIDLK